MPDQFEQLKQKYQPVLTKIQEEGAQLQNLNLDGNQLFLKATAVSEASKNRIWDAIKAVDPNFATPPEAPAHEKEAAPAPTPSTITSTRSSKNAVRSRTCTASCSGSWYAQAMSGMTRSPIAADQYDARPL